MGFIKKTIRDIFQFYRNGFIAMLAWGKKVWLVILIKLFIIFIVLRIFFFPDVLKKNFDSDSERGEHVLDELIIKSNTDD